MRKIIILIFGLCVNLSYTGASDMDRGADGPGGRPNIVLIMADDLDSRQLSCYGGENLKTRYIDQLAAEGMQFNAMIASEAMCVPTRASLFTGLYPVRRSEEHTSELQSRENLVCRLL